MTAVLPPHSGPFAQIHRLLLPALFFFGLGLSAQEPGFPLPPKTARVLVDSLSNQILKYYVDKTAAQKISGYLKERCKMGAYNKVDDPHQLAGLLTSDVLAIRRDEHFHIEYNPVLANEVSGNIEDVPKMVADKLKADRSRNFGFKKAEVLCGNIGYLELSGFSRLNRYSKATADAALQMLANSRALIIDLRYGVGGSPEMMTHIVSHFFKERTHISDIYIRSENATIPYYTTPDSSHGPLREMPIYVLTSYKTFSAAEGLAFALQQLKRATIVGEVTRGGAHTVTYRPISSGFVADIPFGKASSPGSDTTWEGRGIQPDVKVSAEMALETAEAMIFDQALAACKEENEKQNLEWQKALLLSINHPFAADSLTLREYVGDYGVYKVTMQNQELFYQKTGKARFPLVPMKADMMRPRSSENFTVEFLRGSDGAVSRIVTTYDDGRREEAQRKL